jgi:hypothetical protein
MGNSSLTLSFRLVSPSGDDLDFGGIVIGHDDRGNPATVSSPALFSSSDFDDASLSKVIASAKQAGHSIFCSLLDLLSR